MTDESLPWAKNGWQGFVSDYRGTPVGLLTLRARKGDRLLVVPKMTPEQIATFDPDQYWEQNR